ncbi:MAG: hypothetical protein LBG72_04915, partial [Spirochaetaceae bacterium]|nr:hypothetical protein [Spirochaetaceae bacterium]
CANARVPSADAAVKIARALQVSCEYLVTGEETAAGFRTLSLSPETRRIALYAEKLPPARKKLVLALTEELSGGNSAVS